MVAAAPEEKKKESPVIHCFWRAEREAKSPK
jgi:hypothetical protein